MRRYYCLVVYCNLKKTDSQGTRVSRNNKSTSPNARGIFVASIVRSTGVEKDEYIETQRYTSPGYDGRGYVQPMR